MDALLFDERGLLVTTEQGVATEAETAHLHDVAYHRIGDSQFFVAKGSALYRPSGLVIQLVSLETDDGPIGHSLVTVTQSQTHGPGGDLYIRDMERPNVFVRPGSGQRKKQDQPKAVDPVEVLFQYLVDVAKRIGRAQADIILDAKQSPAQRAARIMELEEVLGRMNEFKDKLENEGWVVDLEEDDKPSW